MQSDAKVIPCSSPSSSSSSKKPVFAYLGSWAAYRSGRGKFNISDIDPKLCDYLLYAFFGITERGTVIILDPKLDLEDDGGLGNIRQLEELKRINPSLKTLASIGGANVSSSAFSQVAANPSLRSSFATNARRFCKAHGFDGVDIAWQYPGDGDRWNFVQLLRVLATELHGAGLILTVAVGASESRALESYDIHCIARHVDYVLLMTYDYNGSWDSYTGHNAPLYAGPTDTTEFQQKLNIDHSVQHWLREGAPAHKLILGVPTYGRSFHLSNVLGYGVRAPSDDAGDAGPYTKEAGMLAYYEVLENLQNGWIKTRDDKQKAPYAHSGDQWMSYDDKESITNKCKYVVDHHLGGVMVWSIDTDDFRGSLGCKYPLMQAVNQCLQSASEDSQP
ncbi:chitinase-3-like protein 1 [Anopheles aquasalis]|uniref:chitinase-3-like protein 1 n=1 Tax=Anopheles aquasalis TaxID=42839 RepID=UPI00215A847C|nr:chitinase-3-like protein 1 [Anopheles aquasalis]